MIGQRSLAWVLLLLRRRWRWLLFFVLAAVVVATAPHLRAWYHLRAGTSALEHHRVTESRSHFDACLQVWPKSGPVHLLAARAAWRDRLYEEASQHLEEAQRLLGATEDVLLEWSLLQAASGQIDHKVEEFLWSRLRTDGAQGPLICAALAEGYLHVYRFQSARLCLDLWLEDQPDNVQALSLRAEYWKGINEFQKAAADYRRVVELDPLRHEARWDLALCLLDSGQYAEALPYVEEASRQRPGDPEAQVLMAVCHGHLGQQEQAQEILDDVLRAHPAYGLALREQGRLALLEERPAQAENWLRQALQVLPQDYSTNVSLAEALRQQKKTAEANAQEERVRHLKQRLDLLHAIGTQQMSLRPHDPALHCELGALLLSLDQKDMGLYWLRSALELDPHYRPAHAVLTEYCARQGDTAQAAYHRQLAQEDSVVGRGTR